MTTTTTQAQPKVKLRDAFSSVMGTIVNTAEAANTLARTVNKTVGLLETEADAYKAERAKELAEL